MPWDESENEIMHRVRDPGDFQEGSFRRITFQKASPKVFAIIGKLKGESSTTVQALRFPKAEGWTMAKAKAWVSEHFTKALEDFMEPKMKGTVETKDYQFEVKTVDEVGGFEGMASVYGVIDLGGDMVQSGAFTKSISESPEVPIFWRHNDPIGKAVLEDTGVGLKVKGKLTLGVKQAEEALALMRDNVIKGLSIGFTAIKHEMSGAVRVLKELKLWEVSVVPFPMLPVARITSVKEQLPAAEIEDLISEAETEIKAGRTLSQATRDRIASVITDLTALLESTDKGAAAPTDEPELLHSAQKLNELLMKGQDNG